MRRLFVTGIGTEVGKTVASAMLVEALKADYWKPIQSGDLHYTDSDKIREWCGEDVVIHPEGFRLTEPMSPHASADIDGVSIELADFQLPETNNNLICEGAGGLMVPINHQKQMVLDVIEKLGLEVVLVSRYYLGSINHTLLSIDMLRSMGIPIAGLIFSGDRNESTYEIIQEYASLPIILEISEEETIDRSVIQKYALEVRL